MSLNVMECTPDEALELIVHLLSHPATRHLVPLLHGKPGIGKSSIIAEAGRRLGAEVRDLRLLQLEPAMLRGLEMIDPATRQTFHCRPDMLPPLDESANAPPVILSFDEILACPDSMRKAAFELILDKRVGPHRLGPNVLMVAAGNTAASGAELFELDTPTADRFVHVHVVNDVDNWARWARNNGIASALIAFVESNRTLFDLDATDIDAGHVAFPTQRSWVNADALLRSSPSRPVRDIALNGLLGERVATALIRTLDGAEETVDLMALLSVAPEYRVYPSQPLGQISLARNLAAYATSPDRLRVAVDVIDGMPEQPGTAECRRHFVNLVLPRARMWPTDGWRMLMPLVAESLPAAAA